MRTNRPILTALALLIISNGLLFAQGGSNYSTFGFGDIRLSVGAAYEGMGSTYYGITSPYLVNTANPASWSFVQTTRVQAGYRFNQNKISSSTASTSQNNGKLDGATVLFSIDTGMAISGCIGLYPSSSINYSFTKPISFISEGTTVTGTTSYSGTGGLVTAIFGGSTRVMDGLYVGLAGLYHFGNISDLIESQLDDESFNTALNLNQDKFNGFGLRTGLLYQPTSQLTIGASFSTSASLSYIRLLRYDEANAFGQLVDTSSTYSEHTTSLPSILGLGASYLSGKFLFAADAEFQNFGTTNYRMNLPLSIEYTNASRFSVGVSRRGTSGAGVSYGDRIGINFGAGMKSLYYKVNGENINEYYGSFGLQLPFGGAAMVDASVTAGIRGTTNNNLLSEKFIRCSFSMSVGEIWFVPFKRD